MQVDILTSHSFEVARAVLTFLCFIGSRVSTGVMGYSAPKHVHGVGTGLRQGLLVDLDISFPSFDVGREGSVVVDGTHTHRSNSPSPPDDLWRFGALLHECTVQAPEGLPTEQARNLPKPSFEETSTHPSKRMSKLMTRLTINEQMTPVKHNKKHAWMFFRFERVPPLKSTTQKENRETPKKAKAAVAHRKRSVESWAE